MSSRMTDLSDPLLLRLGSLVGRRTAWVTGGYLRDRLLGRKSHDVDLVLRGDERTIAPAAERIASALGTRPHLIGKPPRAVWKVEALNLKVELWPLGNLSLEEDIRRRDLTCNALAWRLPNGPMTDLVGGLADIERRTLRAVSKENLKSDPVRLLRPARFLAELPTFALATDTARWISELANLLHRAPRERVGQELISLLSAQAPARGLSAMLRLGLFAPAAPPSGQPASSRHTLLLPAASLLGSSGRHPIARALSKAGDSARLGLLFSLWNVSHLRAVNRYAWPGKTRTAALRSALLLPRALVTATASASARRLFIHECGEAFPAVIALAAAVAASHSFPVSPWKRWWRQWERSGLQLLHPRPLISGEQVRQIVGTTSGEEIGRCLRDLREAQVTRKIRSERSARAYLLQLTADRVR